MPSTATDPLAALREAVAVRDVLLPAAPDDLTAVRQLIESYAPGTPAATDLISALRALAVAAGGTSTATDAVAAGRDVLRALGVAEGTVTSARDWTAVARLMADSVVVPDGPPSGNFAVFTTFGGPAGDSTLRVIDIDAWEADSGTAPVTLDTITAANFRHCAIDPATGDIYVAGLTSDIIYKWEFAGGDYTDPARFTRSDWLTGVNEPSGLAYFDNAGTPSLLYTLQSDLDLFHRPLAGGSSTKITMNEPANALYTGCFYEGGNVFLCHYKTDAGVTGFVERRTLAGGGGTNAFGSDVRRQGVCANAAYVYGSVGSTSHVVNRRVRDQSSGETTYLDDGASTCPVDPSQIAINAAGDRLYIAGSNAGTGALQGGLWRADDADAATPAPALERLVTLGSVTGLALIESP